MKFTSSYVAILLLAVTLSSAVPLGQPSYDQRDLSEDADLYAREPGLFGAIAKIGGKLFHHKHSNQRREPLMDDMDLESRGLFRIGAEGGRLRLGHGPVVHPNQRREPAMDAEELESRGLSNEELEARGLFGIAAKIGGKILHHGGKHAASAAMNQNQRREPMMDAEELEARDLSDEELEARGLFGIAAKIGGKILHHGGKHAASAAMNQNQRREPMMDAEELEARDLSDEELEARGLFGIAAKVGGKIFHHGGKHAASAAMNQNQRRDPMLDVEELEARGLLDDDELEARGLFGIAAKIGGKILHHGGKHAASAAMNQNQRREPMMDAEELELRGFDDDELEARGLFGIAAKIGGKVLHHGGKHAASAAVGQMQQNQRRDLMFDEDLE